MTQVIKAAALPVQFDLDTPREIASVDLFFIKPTGADIREAKRIVRESGRTVAVRKTDKATIIKCSAKGRGAVSPRTLMAVHRGVFGHIKSYDGCGIEFSFDIDVEGGV